MKTFLLGCSIILAASLAPLAEGHHSMTGFDRTKTVILTGTVRQFKWANPHSWIEIEVPGDKGDPVVWNVEMTAPGILARAGWKSTLLKSGDKVSIAIRPLLTGDPGGQFVSVTLPDGQVYTERGVQAAKQ
ncbi:MAG TPA: DUF6152 family protein [Bryobacteraceae bacterium]|jgi:hypothetical protein